MTDDIDTVHDDNTGGIVSIEPLHADEMEQPVSLYDGLIQFEPMFGSVRDGHSITQVFLWEAAGCTFRRASRSAQGDSRYQDDSLSALSELPSASGWPTQQLLAVGIRAIG